MLTLSVLLCIGALSDVSAAAAARSLQRQTTTAGERETVATLISSLSEAARKLCHHHTGQAVATVQANADLLIGNEPTALKSYVSPGRCDTHVPMPAHLLNIPPPAATL
jgi:hypothetical protein